MTMPHALSADELTFAAMLLPPVIALIHRARWPHEARTAAAVAVCLVFGLAMASLRGDLDLGNWRSMILQAIIGAVVMHRTLRGPAAAGRPADDTEGVAAPSHA